MDLDTNSIAWAVVVKILKQKIPRSTRDSDYSSAYSLVVNCLSTTKIINKNNINIKIWKK